MSAHGLSPLQYMRDDLRATALLKAHLEAGEFKTEAWALADSLAWALGAFARLQPPPDAESTFSDADTAQHHLAHDRLERVRKAFKR